MKVSISVTSAHRVDDVRSGARFMVERAAAARDAGLDALYVGDHHTTPAPYYQNTAMLARMLAEWNARPAGALYLLPLWHPVLAAEQIATLACIAQGPFVMQCG
ncbi:MAG: LLM class flavin-dependent oxidoreductase, partial [Pseudomonadales bacterium]